MDKNEYKVKLESKLAAMPSNAYLKYLKSNYNKADFDSKICVQIPDYCDPETISTMKSCIQAAANPDRIYFAVCYQGDDMDEFEKIQSFKNCKIKYIPKSKASGLCSARYECTNLTEDVDFAFHIDSHMRFSEFWDVATLQQWYDCNDKNAILSTYAIDYSDTINFDLVSDVRLPEFNGRYINPIYFTDAGKLRFMPRYTFGKKYTPRKSPFIGGHCTFLPLHIDKEIPSDPHMFFIADEIAMAARYWTHGYDIYQFGIIGIYHLYKRTELQIPNQKPVERFNQDKKLLSARTIEETKRMDKLFHVKDDDSVDLTGFDLGTVRSIEEYQEFAGINFKNRIITKFAMDGAFDMPHTQDEYAHVNYSKESEAFNAKYGNCEMYKHSTIAVMIYAFKDNDILQFIDSMIDTAAYPDRIRFYVVYTDVDDDVIKAMLNRDNVIVKHISQYNGLHYAYHILDTMFGDETYVAYFKSRVVPKLNWDAYYINMLHRLGEKSVISEYISVLQGNNENVAISTVSDMIGNRIYNSFCYKKDVEYASGVFAIDDFIFARGHVVRKCVHDPYLTGVDGQLCYSIKLWTNGYNLYTTRYRHFSSLDKILARCTEDDNKRALAYCKTSTLRVDMLLNCANMENTKLNGFDCGHDRSIDSFEKYIGVDFKNHTLSLNTLIGQFGITCFESLSKQFDINRFKKILSKNNMSLRDFVTKVREYVASCDHEGLHEILDRYDIFGDSGVDAATPQKKKNVDTLRVHLLNDIVKSDLTSHNSVPANTCGYTIKDALEIMFKGKELKQAYAICKNILTKSLVAVGNDAKTSAGGIYFDTDNKYCDFGDNKPLLAIAKKNIEGVLTVPYWYPERIWRRLATSIYSRSKVKSVIVTGSDGKTTTKSIISEVLKLDCDQNERFVCSILNQNGMVPFCKDVGLGFDDVKYYVREFGVGGKTDVLTRFSKQFRPDVSVIVNIGESCNFDGGFESRQDVFDTKIRVIDGLKDGGIALVNKDDDMLRNYKYPCDVVTFAINDTTADYTCKDVIEENEYLTFTAVCPDREIKNIVMHIHGIHNVYGALAAIAIADYFCVSDDKIVKGLANFRSDGIRQTVYRAHKNNIIIHDCFGCSIESDTTMLKSLMSIKVPEGARHIAYLGHIASTGIHADEINEKVAKIVASDFNLDLLVCYGGKSKYFCDESLKAGKRAVFFYDDMEAMSFLRNEIREGDAILVKGSGSYLFGHNFKQYIEDDNFKAPEYKGMFANDYRCHGVSKSMLCKNIDTDEVYLDKYADVKRFPMHVTMMFIIAALCDLYKDRMDEQVFVDEKVNKLFNCYPESANMTNNKVVVEFRTRKSYSVKELVRVALDYTALNVVYCLIEQIGRDVFKAYLDKFLKQLDCKDTIIIDPQSYDINKVETTANDLFKVLKYFVKSDSFDAIMAINSDPIVSSQMHSQKSYLLKKNWDDEEDIYCEDAVFVKKRGDRKSASCIAVAKINGNYVASIALDRQHVYRNHATEADVSRMIKSCKDNLSK